MHMKNPVNSLREGCHNPLGYSGKPVQHNTATTTTNYALFIKVFQKLSRHKELMLRGINFKSYNISN